MKAANRENTIHLPINIVAFGEPDVCCEARPKNLVDGESYQPFTVWEEVENTDRSNN